MAELKINNKNINGKITSVRDEIIILLDDMDDETVQFFKEWKDKVDSYKKVDIVKDISITTRMGDKGVLKNAFPIPELCDEYFRIKFDYYEIVG